MKLKSGFVLQNVAGSYLACSTGELTREFRGVIRMNATGAFIWEVLAQDVSFEQIVEKLCEKYDISKEIAEKDARSFVDYLDSYGVVEK